MRARLHKAPFVEHDDQVRLTDGREPVGDDDGRAVRLQQVEGPAQRPLVDGVEVRRRLVEDQDRCILEERPRDRHPLTLAS